MIILFAKVQKNTHPAMIFPLFFIVSQLTYLKVYSV